MKLSEQYPQLKEEWHPTENGGKQLDDFTFGSNFKARWKCPYGSDHEWSARIVGRTSNKKGCPFCCGRLIIKSNSLLSKNPDLAKEWHPTLNKISPSTVAPNSSKKVWWLCEKCKGEWQTTIASRNFAKSSCPKCSGRIASKNNNLLAKNPALAKEWHPNNKALPSEVLSSSHEKFMWRCSKDFTHEWIESINVRTKNGCPFCSGMKVCSTNNLEFLEPSIAKLWHPTQNKLKPSEVTSKSAKKAWWKCQICNFEWVSQISHRRNGNCPACIGRAASSTNNLKFLHPEVAEEWHLTKNGELQPEGFTPGSNQKICWKCKDCKNDWSSTIRDRVQGHGCPYCNSGWTKENLKRFFQSLSLDTFFGLTEVEKLILLKAEGLTQSNKKHLIQKIQTGEITKDKLESFINDKDDDALSQLLSEEGDEEDIPDLTLDQLLEEESKNDSSPSEPEEQKLFELKQIKEIIYSAKAIQYRKNSHPDDIETVNFFIKSGAEKLWKVAYNNEQEVYKIIEQHLDLNNEAIKMIVDQFNRDYRVVLDLNLDSLGWERKLADGSRLLPNLMQRRVATSNFPLNLSGMGSGKTMASILKSKVIEAKKTLIVCPNSTKEQWKTEISLCFPNSEVKITDIESMTWKSGDNCYQIINFEKFQQKQSSNKILALNANETFDFIIVDEIQSIKQRSAKLESQRLENISLFLTLQRKKNSNLKVLGLSGTPLVNNLKEPISLLDLFTGKKHEELKTKITISNALAIYQQLMLNSIRWKYRSVNTVKVNRIPIILDAEFNEELKNDLLAAKSSLSLTEKILLQKKISTILENLSSGTIVYTYYTTDIISSLRKEIENKGWSVGVYDGEDKSGIEKFKNHKVEILIVSSVASTGIDGLQLKSSKIIFANLPYTNKDFDQMIKRVDRQGQTNDVEIIIPEVHLSFPKDPCGEEKNWSFDRGKYNLIARKRTLLDCVVDGELPDGMAISAEKFLSAQIDLLKRLDKKGIYLLDRKDLTIDVPVVNILKEEKDRNLSPHISIHKVWQKESSEETHKRLMEDPEEWYRYHKSRNESKKTWRTNPIDFIYDQIKGDIRGKDLSYCLADLGCGEAELAKKLGKRITVYSFDHIAIDDSVISCDMKFLPLQDSSIDQAVFCLSISHGKNQEKQYLAETKRVLKSKGRLRIVEPSGSFHIERAKAEGFLDIDSCTEDGFDFFTFIKI